MSGADNAEVITARAAREKAAYEDCHLDHKLRKSWAVFPLQKKSIVEIGHHDRRIAQLDGWRGVSVLLVVIGHLITVHYNSTGNFNDPSVAGVLQLWGVNIFFVISGLIITKLALREYKHTGRFSSRNFYTRRIFRIVPPFYLYLVAREVFPRR